MRCSVHLLGLFAWLGTAVLAQTNNPACKALTDAEVALLIGTAKVANATQIPTGSNCVYQGRDKMMIVRIFEGGSEDFAQRRVQSGKRTYSGKYLDRKDLPNREASGYIGTTEDGAVAGVAKGTRFLEVKVGYRPQKNDPLTRTLRAVMKNVAARL